MIAVFGARAFSLRFTSSFITGSPDPKEARQQLVQREAADQVAMFGAAVDLDITLANSRIFWRQPPQGVQSVSPLPITTQLR
jgi:hypothetical protein